MVLIDPLLPPDPEELWPALDERVLVSHGEPVFVGGHAALARALA